MKLEMNTRTSKPVLLLCFCVGLLGCDTQPPSIDVEFRIPVEVESIVTDAVERIVTATGTLRPQQLAYLDNEVPGYIYVARKENGERLVEGDSVVAGQTIAEITGEDARLHAGIESSRISLDNVTAELERRKNLFEQGLIAESEVRQQEVAVENALLDYERSKLNAAKGTLTAPISGVILKLARDATQQPIADGQLVSPGFRVVDIAPLDRLIADVDLIGPELSRVEAGMAVRVRHFAYDEPNPGVVQRLSPTLNPTTHTFRVEIAVDNSNGNFRPGMFVETSIITSARQDVNVVPRTAVTRRADSNVVFLVNGQRVERKEVRLGLSDTENYEVLDGVNFGDEVVVRGLETLTDGARIRVIGS